MIETERLRITEASIEDQTFIFELLNSPTWIAHIGDRGIETLNDASDYIQNSLIHSYQTLGFGLYRVGLTTTGDAIGICGLLQRAYLDHPDIGFALLPGHQGKGYMAEAAAAVLQDAKDRLNLSTIAAITTTSNSRSINLLEQLGFTLISDQTKDETGKSFLHYGLDL